MVKKGGFTLIELLAVLIILSVFATIALQIFINKGDEAKIIAHNENVIILNKQAQVYLLAQDTIVDSEDILANMVSEGYVKEIPKNPISPTDVTAQYKVKVSTNTKTAKVYTKKINELNPGDAIMFHGEAWRIITPATGLIIKPANVIDMEFDADNTQVFDPEDSNNVGYYLNNTYYNTFTEREKSLIKNSEWNLINQDDEIIETVTAYVGLINKEEYFIGKNVGIFPSNGDGTCWRLIDIYTPLPVYILTVDEVGDTSYIFSNGTYWIRPAVQLIETTPLIEVDKGVYNIVEM